MAEQDYSNTPKNQNETQKKTWSQPQLLKLGSVADLTKQTGKPANDIEIDPVQGNRGAS